HLPELLLRMPDVQGQDRSAEQPAELLLQAPLAVDDDLHGLLGPGWKATPRGLVARPAQRRSARAEGRVHFLMAGAMQPTVRAPTQGIHHHQRGTATILTLVALL